MTPEEYFKLCEAHDWDYVFSDDPGRHRAGCQESDRLFDLAQASLPDGSLNGDFLAIHNAWYAYRRHNGPKPQLSDFVPQTNRP